MTQPAEQQVVVAAPKEEVRTQLLRRCPAQAAC